MNGARNLIAVLAGTLAISACGPSPEKEAEDARTRAGSWAAAVKVAVEQWAMDVVPRHYVISTIDSAAADLAHEAARVQARAGADASAPLIAVHHALPALTAAVKNSDETAALDLAARLVATVPPRPIPATARPHRDRHGDLARAGED